MKLNNTVLFIISVVLLFGLFSAYSYRMRSKGCPYNNSQDQWRNWDIQRETKPTIEVKSVKPKSYKEALELSKSTGKQIFICFQSDSCKWCKKLEKETLNDPRIKRELENYIVYVADQDQEPKLAEVFHVTGLPAYFIIDSGNITKKGQGFRPPAAFLIWIKTKAILQ